VNRGTKDCHFSTPTCQNYSDCVTTQTSLLAFYAAPVLGGFVEHSFHLLPVLEPAGEVHGLAAYTTWNPEVVLIIARTLLSLAESSVSDGILRGTILGYNRDLYR